ncbi:hypothetical protein AM588_10002688 [Phytophthora nicotianae]|uniref:Serine-threonine protein phosphatase N-terminal domain-containing protein n=1 Tax=Phytophthora nicotianae TaxID=4792 RepID=A0A0W8CRX0_PHYNI|nr:hypothetical protein AM588_10002688 [Phytophthora nicotianae]
MASSGLEPIDVDSIIEKLLSVRGARPGKQVNLTETEIRGLCLHAREVFLAQPFWWSWRRPSRFAILKPAEKKQRYAYNGLGTQRPATPPRK